MDDAAMTKISAWIGHAPLRGGTHKDSRKPTRNEQVSGSSPLVGSLIFLQIP
jgi:hypothetical protein